MKIQPDPNGVVEDVKSTSAAQTVQKQSAPPEVSASEKGSEENSSELTDRDGKNWPRVDPNTGRGRFFDGFA